MVVPLRIFLVLAAIFHIISGCPTGWYGFGNSCYLFKVRTLTVRGLSWEDARRKCLNYGGDLVSVANKSEMDFIYSKSSQHTNEKYWIGLNDRQNESLFVWSDGIPYNRSVYSNWYPNEPNDRADEDCVELYGRKWNDNSCKKEFSYICERPKGVAMPTFKTVALPPTYAPIACPAGWEFYGSSCYKFSDMKKNWLDAKTDCRTSGGYLLKIDDANEQHFITYRLVSGNKFADSAKRFSALQHGGWIGLTDAAVEGTYRWEGDNSLVNYTHWATEEPNDFGGVEDCVSVWGGASAGFWNDDYCDTEHYYICEKPEGRNLCPVNWRSFGDFCYQFNVHGALHKNWVDAEKVCMSYNRSTELISIDSVAEQAFVLRQLKDLKGSQVWLGLNDRKVEGRYEWSDKSQLSYRNWEAGEPSTGVSARISDCTVIDGNTQNGTWSTSPCFFRRGYICKRKRGMGQCDSPFGMEDGNIDDSQITASSIYNASSQASQARLRLASSNTTVGAWCSARNTVGEYLQVDLGVVRQITHIALQGRPQSSEFVKTFYLKYGNNGLDFNSYGQNATVKYKILTGNLNAKLIKNIVLPESIDARFLRIYPLTWNSRICLRTEIYGCAAQASSRKCGVGWEVGLDSTCYQINSNQRKLWADARASCLNRGGDLVSILSIREKNWLNNRLKALSGWAYSFWIGLNDRDMHKHFYWSDGSPVRLTAWDGGYPKDYTSQNLRACVEIDATRGAWRDVSCGEYRPFICKRKMASTNDVKFPVTGNWISGTDYYWPMDAIVDGMAIGTLPATAHGIVLKSDHPQNGWGTLQFRSYHSYLDAGSLPVLCVTDPTQCSNGITVSLVVRLENATNQWVRKTFIVDTIGDETFLQGNRGFAVYVVNGHLYVKVLTRTREWTVDHTIITGPFAWQHVMFTWQLEKGLQLYLNGSLSTSMQYGKTTLHDSSARTTLTIGSKSNQTSAGEYYMRSLAVWKRALSSQEVKGIYLAEYGNCRTGWKDFGQYCYQFNLNKKSWSDARVACMNQQAQLASIHSPVEQAHITLEVGPYGLQAHAWIGLHDQGVESEFEWSDGSAVQYTNWKDWNPDNWANSEDCVNVRSDNDGRWNDENCRTNRPFICKRPKEYFSIFAPRPKPAPQKKFICQYTSAVLSCPLSTVLTITSATWGRTDVNQCGYVSVNNCRLNVTSNIKAKCDGTNHCSLRASSSFGSEPCRGVFKYLEIDYVCRKGRRKSPRCSFGWEPSPDGSRCFALMFDRKSWKDARSKCRKSRAELASFHSSTENIFLTSLLVNSWDIGDVGGIWIGLADVDQKGVYNWTDNSTVDYTSWLNGQPDARKGSCVRASLQPGKMSWLFWEDEDCAQTFPYACAKDSWGTQQPTVPTTTGANTPCPSGWVLNGPACYKMIAQRKTWTAARDACRIFSQNSDLVSIHSLAENTFVANLLNNSAFSFWIGLSDRGVLFGYGWSDKSPVGFTRWNPQQPDSHHGQQPCVEMYSTGEWGDTGCYSVKQFVCKMPRSDNVQSTGSPTTAPAVPSTQAPGICPPGWILWNRMCYYFANDSTSSKLSWYDARTACQKIRGGDLVSILSRAENSFIKSRIARHSSSTLWIGLNDIGTEASYKWSDGSPVAYTNYNYQEPNDWIGVEDCLEMHRWNGKWNDLHCSMLRPYICKKTNNSLIPAFTLIPPTPGPTLGRCKNGWVNYDKSCYLFVSDYLQDWTNARDVCRKGLNTSMKGDLVTVDDQYEQAFLTSMLKDKQTNFWIGFNDIFFEGSFFWTDNSQVKYTNWNAKQPQGSGYSSDCVDLTQAGGNAGRWNNVACSQKKGFICETGALPLGPTTGPPSNGTCPPHYELLGDDCYFVSYVKLSWQEAREACQRESGGDLMSVHSPYEQAFVVRSLKNDIGGLWLGFVREAGSAEFTWSDNSVTIYTYWAANEPDDMWSQRSCVVANNSYSNAGLWDEIDCSARNGFICRIRKGEPYISPSVLGSCPNGWKNFENNCYQFKESNKLPWTAARAACQRQGSDLVSITSRHEQDFIAYHYRYKSSFGNLWIGLNDRAVERGYTWSDGSPVTFINWLSGEPSNNFYENCIEMFQNDFQWNDLRCIEARGYICKQPLECSAAQGMGGDRIKANQVTASSSLSAQYSPGMARLHSSTAWCAGNSQAEQFIQVDLLTETRLTKISTQGFIFFGVASYIRTFTIQTSEDGVNFKSYKKNGKDWVFVANRDANSVVTSAIKPPVDTRLIRLLPVSWTGSLCIRMEFYGCPYACEKPLGLQSGAVKDASLSASSYNDSSHMVTHARPSQSTGWCSKPSDAQPWIQISFPDVEKKITKISTWGGGKGAGYVTVYRLAFTDVADVTLWSDYREGGKIRNFRGNQDSRNPMTHRLAEPIITRTIRVKPQHWSPLGACLRLELFGCEDGCDTALGLRQGIIRDSAISASSLLDQSHAANQGRLNGSTGWCASDSDKEAFFVVDLGRIMKIHKVSMQGAKDGKGFIKSYTMSTRDDASLPWRPFSQDNKKMVFLANIDSTSVVSTLFESPTLLGRYIKIKAVTWSIRPCLRLELFGCRTDVHPTPASSSRPPTETQPPPKNVAYAGSVKLSKEEWTDDYKNSNSDAYRVLASKVEKSIKDVYSGVDEASLAFSNVMVTGFRRGSVIVWFNLTFTRDIADDLGTNVTRNLVKAVRSGSLGGIAVDPDSLTITQSAWNGNAGNHMTAAARTGGKSSSGLSSGAKAGIAVTVLLLVGLGFGAAAWWFHKHKRGKHLSDHQQFNNPVYFSSEKQSVDSSKHVKGQE